jgi:Ser/Thr protein kinase RdoA (MazF antagonist)
LGLLRGAYGVEPLEIDRIRSGQATINFRVLGAGGPVFVKRYLETADPDAERAAIALSALAGESGVPVARAIRSRSGDTIATRDGVALSVWEWVEGETIVTGLRRPQLRAAGVALGRIHRRFAGLPESRGAAPRTVKFLSFDLPRTLRRIDRLLAAIAAKEEHDDFDLRAAETLRERRATIDRVPALIAGFPELASQVIHGDYSVVNLLFAGDELAAVIDFRPPNPYLVAFELGRIAFDAQTVGLGDDWVSDARTVVEGYLAEHPEAAGPDVAACGRVALVHLLSSFYGVEEHYQEPGLFQEDIDAYWLMRHRAASLLLERLEIVEDTLRGVVEAARRGRAA